MTAIEFPEANTRFGPPAGLDEAQVRPCVGHVREIVGGSCDGLPQVIVAWKPSNEDVKRIIDGELIYLSCIGSLPPHFLTTSFVAATQPA